MLMGDKVIEIKSNKLDKGKAAVDIVNRFKPDFIFAIGDDATDEDMFYKLPNTAITVKVGSKNSSASYYVENQQQARSEEHTSELQSRENLVCRLLLEKQKG